MRKEFYQFFKIKLQKILLFSIIFKKNYGFIYFINKSSKKTFCLIITKYPFRCTVYVYNNKK